MTSLAPASRPLVLADRVVPRAVALVTNVVLVLAGTALVALCSQPVDDPDAARCRSPMQTLRRAARRRPRSARPRGAVSLGLYLVLGVVGLPVFARQPPPAALFAALGRLHRRLRLRGRRRRMARATSRGTVTSSRPCCRSRRLARDLRLRRAVARALARPRPLPTAIMVGVVPFLIGDALKALLAAGVLPGTWKLHRPRREALPRSREPARAERYSIVPPSARRRMASARSRAALAA